MQYRIFEINVLNFSLNKIPYIFNGIHVRTVAFFVQHWGAIASTLPLSWRHCCPAIEGRLSYPHTTSSLCIKVKPESNPKRGFCAQMHVSTRPEAKYFGHDGAFRLFIICGICTANCQAFQLRIIYGRKSS